MKQTVTPELGTPVIVKDPTPADESVMQSSGSQLDPPPLAASAPDDLNGLDDDRHYALHWGINE